eukprot:gene30702-34886_t
MLDTTPTARAEAILAKLDAALAAGDIETAVGMFADECYWRDLVTFTWNIKTMEGRTQVRDMLTACLSTTKPSNWHVAPGTDATDGNGVLEAWFTFETALARGYGLIRVLNGQIWTLLTTM